MNATTLKTDVLLSEVLASLLAGTGRQPIASKSVGERFDTSDPAGSLKALSLAGQALRFERPPTPAQFSVELSVADYRKILPQALRRLLLRLLAGKSVSEHPALALATAFDRLRMRPHPFDLPRLDGFIRTYAEQLGPTAQHWARSRQDDTEPSPGYFDDEVLSDENWTHATLSRRATYLERRRGTDAAAARALLEAAWPVETADVRLSLLQTMRTGLDESDRQFLEPLEKDRAPRVRALAQRLLARLGVGLGGAENPALRAVQERIRRTQTGLLRKRPQLTLELPATVKEQAAPSWVRDAFADVCFDEFAAAVSLTETEVIEASAKDSQLLLALALMATADRRFDLFEQIVTEHLPHAWELLHQSGLRDLDLMPREQRLRWAELLIRPYGSNLPASYVLWSWLHRTLDQPGPPELVETILGTTWLDQLPDLERQGALWMEVIAALCPPGQYQQLRHRLSSFEAHLTTTAMSLLDILDAMEKAHTHV